jgi:pyrroloquinoline quinone (PQQ) biosynthesis protein C
MGAAVSRYSRADWLRIFARRAAGDPGVKLVRRSSIRNLQRHHNAADGADLVAHVDAALDRLAASVGVERRVVYRTSPTPSSRSTAANDRLTDCSERPS